MSIKTDVVSQLLDISSKIRETDKDTANVIVVLATTIVSDLTDRIRNDSKSVQTPSWDDAPEEATYRLIHPFGIMYFYGEIGPTYYEGTYPIEKRPEKPKAPELKPCPFCGSSDVLTEFGPIKSSVSCKKCLASAYYSMWNDRV